MLNVPSRWGYMQQIWMNPKFRWFFLKTTPKWMQSYNKVVCELLGLVSWLYNLQVCQQTVTADMIISICIYSHELRWCAGDDCLLSRSETAPDVVLQSETTLGLTNAGCKVSRFWLPCSAGNLCFTCPESKSISTGEECVSVAAATILLFKAIWGFISPQSMTGPFFISSKSTENKM